MVVECELLGGIEHEIVTILFLIEVFFELVIMMFLFFVPVSNFGFGSESVTDVVIVHCGVKLYFIK